MAIQKVWLHGRGCDCDDCVLMTHVRGDSNALIVMSRGENFDVISIRDQMNTIIKDQYGQRYIITPIPDME